MPVARAFFHDAADVGQKAHVQHAVGFVEDKVLDLVEAAGAAAHVIEQPSGRGDDDVHAVAQGIHLLAIADAAVKDGGAEIGEAGEITKGGFDLGGEFAGGFQDRARGGRGACWPSLERMGRAKAAVLPVPVCALPMTSCAGQDERNGAQLDGRGLDVAHGLDTVNERGSIDLKS